MSDNLYSGTMCIRAVDQRTSVVVKDHKGIPLQHSATESDANFREGYGQGYRDAKEECRSQIGTLEAQASEIAELPESLNRYLGELEQQLTQQITNCTIAAAEIILRDKTKRKSLIKSTLKEALAPLAKTEDVYIAVSPEDLSLLKQLDVIGLDNTRMVADPGLKPGDTVVHTKHGLLDATISGRLQTLAERLDRQLAASGS